MDDNRSRPVVAGEVERQKEAGMSKQKKNADRARANMLKVVRAAVRLKHSINADNELFEILPKAEANFDNLVLRGQIPEPLDVVKRLGI